MTGDAGAGGLRARKRRATGYALIAGAGSVLGGPYRVALAGAAAAESRREEVRERRWLTDRHPELLWHLFSRLAGFGKAIAAAGSRTNAAGVSAC